jgi:hypothetical protein
MATLRVTTRVKMLEATTVADVAAERSSRDSVVVHHKDRVKLRARAKAKANSHVKTANHLSAILGRNPAVHLRHLKSELVTVEAYLSACN